MTEDRLQHDIVMWFSQTFPQEQDRLFMVQNTTYSKAHGNRMKAMGLRKSVPDMFFVGRKFAGIELKAPGSVHKRSHVMSQLLYGEKMRNHGHLFLMTQDKEMCMSFLLAMMNEDYEISKELEHAADLMIRNLLGVSAQTVRF